jgi:flavin reductase (DIM6/NTAB) family NADH-FMN oxidoreductase RutF
MNQVNPKEAFNRFKPESVVFVISYDNLNNRPSGMVAGWSMKCSSDPFMMAVAIWKENYTYRLISDVKEFVVAVPNKGMEKYIGIFGTKHGNEFNKFAESKILTEKAKCLDKVPLLSEATINFECKLVSTTIAGDHAIYVGEILTAHVNEDKGILLNMGKDVGKRVFQEFQRP